MWTIRKSKIRRVGSALMLASLVGALFLMLDPTDMSWGATLTVEYFPIFLALFSWLAFRLSNDRMYKLKLVDWFLAAFLIVVFCGGAFSLVNGGELSETYLRAAVPGVVMFPAAKIFESTSEARWLMRRFGVLSIMFSLLVSSMTILWAIGYRFVDALHIFHEEIFLLAFSMLALYFLSSLSVIVVPIGFLFFGGVLATMKNTGFIVAAVMSLILFILLWKKRAPFIPGTLMLRRWSLLSISLLICISASLLFFEFSEFMPSGSPDVRLYTYALRLGEFLESPIFGSLFVGSTLIDVSFKNLYIPSHSDLLDILSFGGVLSFLLFFGPVSYLLYQGLRYGTNYGKKFQFEVLGAAVILLLFILDMTFNPIWMQPKVAIFLWFSIGVLLGANRRKLLVN